MQIGTEMQIGNTYAKKKVLPVLFILSLSSFPGPGSAQAS